MIDFLLSVAGLVLSESIEVTLDTRGFLEVLIVTNKLLLFA